MLSKAPDLKTPVPSHVFQLKCVNLKLYFYEAYLSMFDRFCGQSILEDEYEVCAVPDGDGDDDIVASGYPLGQTAKSKTTTG